MFGFFVTTTSNVSFNLLEPPRTYSDKDPLEHARSLATEKFKDQLKKTGVELGHIQVASLTVSRSTESRLGDVNGSRSYGFDLTFLAKATTDLGKTFESSKVLFVAPHDRGKEFRSTRGHNNSLLARATQRVSSIIRNLIGGRSTRA